MGIIRAGRRTGVGTGRDPMRSRRDGSSDRRSSVGNSHKGSTAAAAAGIGSSGGRGRPGRSSAAESSGERLAAVAVRKLIWKIEA
jgi:hypothetical protein